MYLGGGTCELVLDRLKIGNRFSELLALARVLDGVVQRALREPDHLGADGDPPLIQRFNGGAIALADFAQHVAPWDTTILEQQLARAAGADPELVFFLAH